MHQREQGFTLIEVIITLVIFTLVILLFSSMMQTITMINTKALDITSSSVKDMNGIMAGNSTTSAMPGAPLHVTFSNGSKVDIEIEYVNYTTPSNSVTELYQCFRAKTITTSP